MRHSNFFQNPLPSQLRQIYLHHCPLSRPQASESEKPEMSCQKPTPSIRNQRTREFIIDMKIYLHLIKNKIKPKKANQNKQKNPI